MAEKSEVQNLDGQTPATEPLDPAPRATEAEQVENGEPKDYRHGANGDDESETGGYGDTD